MTLARERLRPGVCRVARALARGSLREIRQTGTSGGREERFAGDRAYSGRAITSCRYCRVVEVHGIARCARISQAHEKRRQARAGFCDEPWPDRLQPRCGGYGASVPQAQRPPHAGARAGTITGADRRYRARQGRRQDHGGDVLRALLAADHHVPPRGSGGCRMGGDRKGFVDDTGVENERRDARMRCLCRRL